ncbi:MAG: 50S ribosomal protein L38e [Candidatus Bathyarchaeia archaeon]
MPSEISDLDQFVKLSERALYCKVKRSPEMVKLKLRTKKRLYTIKLEPARADEVLKSLRCETREV